MCTKLFTIDIMRGPKTYCWKMHIDLCTLCILVRESEGQQGAGKLAEEHEKALNVFFCGFFSSRTNSQ